MTFFKTSVLTTISKTIRIAAEFISIIFLAVYIGQSALSLAHKQDVYTEWNNENYPTSEKRYNEVLSLPIGGVQSLENTKKIVYLINKFV